MVYRVIVVLAAVATFAMSPSHATGQTASGCRFPGPPASCPAPSGRLILEWREPTAAGRHELWLRVRANGRRAKLLEFDRSVDAQWAPDGRALAITDHAGSSDSVLWIASGEDLTRLVNVEERLRSSLGELPDIFENGHRYFEAVRWLRPDLLLFRVHAYDRHLGQEYVRTFRYDLRGRVNRDRRR